MARKHEPKYQYVIRTANGLFIGPVKNGLAQIVETLEEAERYDDRDNHNLKCRFFRAAFGAEFFAQLI